MELLKQRIMNEGRVEENCILKVDNFLNYQIDVPLFLEMGNEFKKRFSERKIDKILTIESSGIGVAFAVSLAFNNIPVVFAKKKDGCFNNVNAYTSKVFSYTKGKECEIMVDKKYIVPGETILIIDDFLANGNAAMGLADIVSNGEAVLAGVGAVIEKGFQNGRKMLQENGIQVESLVIVKEFCNNKVVFDQ